MNFNRFDIVILVTMSLSIVLMSIIFPAVGLADESDTTNESDRPEYNTTAQRFDIVGDFPDSPGSPGQFDLFYDDDAFQNGDTQHWLTGDTSGGIEVVVLEQAGSSTVKFNDWSSGSVVGSDEFTVSSVGDRFQYNNNSWSVEGEVTNYSTDSNDDDFNVTFETLSKPSDKTIFGGVFSTVDKVAAVLGYIGGVVYWFAGALIETALAVVTQLFGVVTYAVDMGVWLTTSYTSVVGSAGSWASFVLAVPGILLFAEFAKLVMIGISLLPTT